ncbi:MAG TPA: hypothetical protein VLF42_00410 [Burkholderiales bacterium]|nr:hypothetical protein [Burkholderiales bacterium]
MKLTEYGILGVLLVPTAALATSILITFAAPHEIPQAPGIYTTSPAIYYADMEKQP